MTISYPLAFPDDRKVAALTFRKVSTVGESRSPFDGTVTVFPWDGEWWEADITLPPMTARDAYDWCGWMAALNGIQGTFLLGDPARLEPFGVAATNPGTPRVNGAGQTGKTLAIDGCPNSITGYLRRGDYIQLGTGASSRVHMLTAQADTNGSGQVVLDLWPRLRTTPADNDLIYLTNTKTVMAFAENTQQWQVQPRLLVNGITLSVRERL